MGTHGVLTALSLKSLHVSVSPKPFIPPTPLTLEPEEVLGWCEQRCVHMLGSTSL